MKAKDSFILRDFDQSIGLVRVLIGLLVAASLLCLVSLSHLRPYQAGTWSFLEDALVIMFVRIYRHGRIMLHIFILILLNKLCPKGLVLVEVLPFYDFIFTF